MKTRGAGFASAPARIGLAPAGTLLYASDHVTTERVRYDQLAFVEHQKGGDALLQQEACFYAATASEKAWLVGARSAGRVVRAWQLDAASQWTDPPVTFPATDSPSAAWYTSAVRAFGAHQ